MTPSHFLVILFVPLPNKLIKFDFNVHPSEQIRLLHLKNILSLNSKIFVLLQRKYLHAFCFHLFCKGSNLKIRLIFLIYRNIFLTGIVL